MSTRPSQLDDLVKRWEDSRQQGEDITPAELCSDCPELLDTLRRHLEALKAGEQGAKGFAVSSATVGFSAETETGPPMPAVTATAAVESPPMPDVEPQPGAEPIPGFRLIRLLGSGGFGSVWKAEAPGNFQVAMKFVTLFGQVGASELRSLDVLRHLRHPNLLTTFGAWRSNKYLIIAMELADCTLADLLKRAKEQGLPGIPREELLEYYREAAKGIDYLNEPHRLIEGQEPIRVQHRDIKPANILTQGNGVKVADFGLARMMDHTMVSHTGGMTPAYAAPEFFQGQTSRHSDQYCLAVTYCELRGGRIPFGGTFAELVMGHVEGVPDLTMLPESERPVVARALSKKPEQRWPSCVDFVDALNRAGSRPVVEATQLQPSREKPTKKSRVLWPIFLLLIAIGAGAVWKWPAIRGLILPEQKPSEKEIVRRDDPNDPKFDRIKEKEKDPDKDKEKIEVKKVDVHVKPDKDKEKVEEKKIEVPVKAPEKEILTVVPRVVEPLKEPVVGERLRFLKHGKAEIRSLAGIPNSTRVLSGDSQGNLWLWDSTDGKDFFTSIGNTKAVQTIAVSADGRLALVGGDDMAVRLFDLETRKDPKVFRIKRKNEDDKEFEFYGCGFLNDGRILAAGNSEQLIIWDRDSGGESGRIETSLKEVFCIAVARDGRRALIGGANGALVFRETKPDPPNENRKDTIERMKSKEIRFEGHLDDVLSVALFPDGERFASGGGLSGPDEGKKDHIVRVWRIGDAKPILELKGHEGKVYSLAVSADGKRILSGDSTGAVRLWDSTNGREYPRFDQIKKGESSPGLTVCVMFSADGREAISGHKDGSLRVWTLPGAEP